MAWRIVRPSAASSADGPRKNARRSASSRRVTGSLASQATGTITSGGAPWWEVVRSAPTAPWAWRTTSATSARNMSRAWSSSATSAESSSGECCRIRLDW